MTASVGSSNFNGDAGVRFYRAWINCDSAASAAYAEEYLGMSK